MDRVRECDFALILITPSSVNKPWILWEAGAVSGAATAANAAFFIGKDERAIGHLRAARALRPDAGSIATIERGVNGLARRIEGGGERVKPLLAALRS